MRRTVDVEHYLPAPGTMYLSRIAYIVLALLVAAPARATGEDAFFREAERQYLALEVNTRLLYQILLTSAGYWPAVPNVAYSRRLHAATRQFQADRGEPPTGILTRSQVEQLLDAGTPVLKGWGFRSVSHPTRGRTLWVPNGLGLSAERTSEGVAIREPKNQFKLKYSFYDGIGVQQAYDSTLREMVASGDNILYKTARNDFFVIAGNQGKYHRYVRYHSDGSGILGFDMAWSNDDAPVFGNRLVTIISGSFWASMTGAPFPAATPIRYPWETEPQAMSRVNPSPSPAVPDTKPPARKEGGASSGTGFFITAQGHVVTNEHVIGACSTVMVKADGAPSLKAAVLAADRTNDLALLKVDQTPPAVADLRLGIRLGEPVAVFGYPLAKLLATSGNFTLGNVTALAGLGDDARHVQISAPVQPGNSGGPLLDESGNVVGIVTYKLDAIRSAAMSGDIPQNVNFAIKSTALANFLDVHRITYRPVSPGAGLKPAELAERARSISVSVECR
ncbi:MAG TPA: serine protease [Microvirga sp.]|nr:serine protease [Microvirga sp.]